MEYLEPRYGRHFHRGFDPDHLASAMIPEWLRNLLRGVSGSECTRVGASSGSVAIGGDNLGHISIDQSIYQGLGTAQFTELQSSLGEIKHKVDQLRLPSDETIRQEVEKALDGEIDTIRSFIEEKPITALALLEGLYSRVAGTASGRIRFRIRANAGICHYVLGDDLKASEFLFDAYAQAPDEPKAISNKVLALLLKNATEEAFRFGLDELKRNPTNDSLAGYVVQAAKSIDRVHDPLDLIPEGLHKCVDVLLAYIHFLQQRGRQVEWWNTARVASELFPENAAAGECLASAIISEVSQNIDVHREHKVNDSQAANLRIAASKLKLIWDKTLRSEQTSFRQDQVAVGCNLSTTYHLLHDIEAIKQIAATVSADLRSTDELREHVARIAFQCGLIEISNKLLDLVGDSPSAAFLRFHHFAITENFDDLSQFDDETLSRFPDCEQRWAQVLLKIARYESGGEKIDENSVRSLIVQAGDDERALVLVMRFAERHEYNELSDEAYKAACSLIKLDSEFSSRMMVAREASIRHDWDKVIAILEGYVSNDSDSFELWLLATAYCNISPPREEALQFFNTLPEGVSSKPKFRLLSGVFHYNRGALDEATSHLKDAYRADSTDLYTLLTLLQTYIRRENREAVEEILSDVVIDALHGTALQKMHLAQLLARHGKGLVALDYAYRTLCANQNDAKVALTYVGLILMLPDESLLETPQQITPGCWILIEDEHGQTFECLVNDGGAVYGHSVLPVTHPLVASAMSRAVNDTFEQPRPFGPPQVWNIREIKHKYIHAMHDIMASYEHRFPEHPGLFQFKVTCDDGISVLLDGVKTQSEEEQQVLRSYQEKHLPLAALAIFIDSDVIRTASKIRSDRSRIIANTGNFRELIEKSDDFTKGNYEAAVLDTYTAWTCACCDLFSMLGKTFSRLIVPRSVIDDLQILQSAIASPRYGDGMSLAWRDGQFYRVEFSAEQLREQVQYIGDRITDIQTNCDVQTVLWSTTPSSLASQVTTLISETFWDAAYLATQSRNLLLSEDLFYRQWAKLAFLDLNDTWLQAVFWHGKKTGLFTGPEYAKALLGLASCQHHYVSVDADTLLEIYEQDDSSLNGFATVADYIGGRNAEWRSHIQVCRAFLKNAWRGNDRFDFKVKRATGILLEKLFRNATNHWPFIFVIVRYGASPALCEYLDAWSVGHFLSAQDISAAKKRIFKLLEKAP